MNSKLSQVLTEARVSRGLTQREAANYLGITPMFLSELESGKKIPTKGKALETIADFYKISYQELLAIAMTSKAEKESKVVDVAFTQRMALARTLMSRPISSDKIDEILKILKEDTLESIS